MFIRDSKKSPFFCTYDVRVRAPPNTFLDF
jgi:hypothetical protein